MGYAYHLAKWSTERDKTLLCPGCQKKFCYKEYVDEDGNAVDGTNHLCGKCDHEWCGYHVTPSEYFKLNPNERQKVAEGCAKKPQRHVKRIEIERHYVDDSMQGYDRNVFVQYLLHEAFDEETMKALPETIAMYLIGTTNDGGTIWWQMDENGIVRTGKKMMYKPDGHRLKDENGAKGINWIHAMLRKRGMFPEGEYDLVQCLFGQHLLKSVDQDATIHIVESEKTAVLMSLFDKKSGDGHVWMACGGLSNLKEEILLPLRGHKILLYPDANGVGKWTEKVRGMANVRVATSWMKLMTKDDPPGADIADIYLRKLHMTPEAKLEEMKEKNKALVKLINNLDLRLNK